MVSLRKYDKGYEQGRCPYGFEFISGYNDSHSVWNDSYCRKIRKVRIDMEERIRIQKHNEEQEMYKAREEYWI